MTNYPYLPYLCLNYNGFQVPSLSPERGFFKIKRPLLYADITGEKI